MALRQLRHDLWETTPYSPFEPLTTHAYLWTPSAGGNVLFYAPGNEEDFDHIEELGGVAHHYLSHQDEAGPAVGLVADRFGSVLHVPAAEVDAIARFASPDVLMSDRVVDDSGVEVIPTPGHTIGSTSFVVVSGAERYLFTGDTLLVGERGNWFAGYLPGMSDREQLVASLDILAGVRPTLVASSAFAARGATDVDPGRWPAYVAEARDELTQGAGVR